ncbi:H-type small acid-soluble spore protein [Evansella sp. AB-rgal1]|uniref:H-type small acid-soluble spore protein n=1 Tax=Evansella sp. AB-rgal1 TaxID=3242696 RepID=UPI00359E34D8
MKCKRVQEIIDSPNMINVRYNGIPVYIQEVLPNKETARVFPLDEMGNEQDVDIEGLVEDPIHTMPH